MSEKTLTGRVSEIIDRVACREKIIKIAHFKSIAQTIAQSVLGKNNQAIDEILLEKTMTWGWNILEHKGEDCRISFEDGISDIEKNITLVVRMSDLPFIVDTVTITISRFNIPVINFYNIAEIAVSRDAEGYLAPYPTNEQGEKKECIIFFEIEAISESEKDSLVNALSAVLKNVIAAVDDWKKMQDLMMEVVDTWHTVAKKSQQKALEEIYEYMQWLHEYYTFLGARAYSLIESSEGETCLVKDKKNGLGILKSSKYMTLPEEDLALEGGGKTKNTLGSKLFYLAKSTAKCNIHRDVYTDLLVLSIFDEHGKRIGEVRFAGLLSSEAYDADPSKIPWIRKKIHDVIELSNLKSRHSTKSLAHILKNIPTDELFQCTTAELKTAALMQLSVKGLNATKVVIRKDILNAFYTIIILMPKDYYNSQVLRGITKYIQTIFCTERIDWVASFSDISLVSIYYTIRVSGQESVTKKTPGMIEAKLKEIATPWWDGVMTAYRQSSEGVAHNQLIKYREILSPKYQSKYSGDEVVRDISYIENIKKDHNEKLSIRINSIGETKGKKKAWSIKIYQLNSEVILSNILPCLENLGLSVIRENSVDIHDFDDEYQVYTIVDLHVSPNYSEVMLKEQRTLEMIKCIQEVDAGRANNDAVNKLLTMADIPFDSLVIIRAFIYYAKQTNFALSTEYMLQTIIKYPAISERIIGLFNEKFSPEIEGHKLEAMCKSLTKDLEALSSINDDRVFRRMIHTIKATVRTNFFCDYADALVLKIKPREIPDIPQPVPVIETFVFSHRVVGTHLRMSLVSRGGIRWSSRLEDYRTEVLGLMHAQQLKNAVIVPDGAKGVFVPKLLNNKMTRDEYFSEGLECYKILIKSMISISDNYQNEKIVKPLRVKCYDKDDTYFVVAADKGTATFSDYANEIAYQAKYWLGDAFASGGQYGYDHKKIGITAKGAWQSVRWHFLKLGIDTDRDRFTVVGIGDMSGDVFGNGMLLTRNICLLAAFDHRHIFLDPKPCGKSSFKERERLFKLPRSSWDDYDRNLISKGGGVYARADKYIYLTDEVKAFLNTEEAMLTPNDLIKKILSAEVDLIWNGGIGTYIRASSETDAEAKDMANDNCRIAASSLKALVIAEGGNLGITQLGRIEYSLQGGLINTDFIDNVGGVSCSDREVNIKIALAQLQKTSGMTMSERNKVMMAVQDEVEHMILNSIYMQNFAISVGEMQAEANLEIYLRYISFLERKGISNPKIDKLPSKKEALSRQALGKYLVRSELAILYSHTKTLLVGRLIKGTLVDDPYCLLYLYHAFPKAMADKYGPALIKHVLKREIIATQISDMCINDMGLSYIQQMRDETRCSEEVAVKAYFISLEIFQMRPALNFIYENLEKIETENALALINKIRKLLIKSACWLVNNIDLASGGSMQEIADIFLVPVEILAGGVMHYLNEEEQQEVSQVYEQLINFGAGEKESSMIAHASFCADLLNVVWSLKETTGKIERFAQVYFNIAKIWSIDWIKKQIDSLEIDSIWTQIARAAMMADIDGYHRDIAKYTFELMRSHKNVDCEKTMEEISSLYKKEYEDWSDSLAQMKSLQSLSYPVFAVAVLRMTKLCEVMRADLNTVSGRG